MAGWLQGLAKAKANKFAVSSDEADQEDDWQPGQKSSEEEHMRNISLSVAELKVHQKNIQKTRRHASGYKPRMCI